MASGRYPDTSSASAAPGYDQTTTVAVATNSIVFTGLDGNADGIYAYSGYILHATNSNVNVALNPNSLTTNKVMRGTLESGNALSDFGFGDWLVAECASNSGTNGGYSLISGTLYAKSGKVRFLNFSSSNFTNSTSTALDHYLGFNGWWKDTSANITSLEFKHGTAGGFGVGTTIRVRKVSGGA